MNKEDFDEFLGILREVEEDHNIDEYGKHFKNNCLGCKAENLLKNIKDNDETENIKYEEAIYYLLDQATEVGIYPKSNLVNGIETQRSEWQNGWNDCAIEIAERHSVLLKWYRELDKKYVNIVNYLLKNNIINFNIDTKKREVEIFLIVNDIFCCAADFETVSMDDLNSIYEMNKKFKFDGVIAFVANKRGEEPLYINERYKEAKKYLEGKNEDGR